jgi:hypothetical protein
VWWNDGQRAFARSHQHLRYSRKHGLAVGDFNGNGQSEVFAAAYSSDYSVWYNQGGSFQFRKGDDDE